MNYISVTDTAKMMRKALKEAFPGIKFSVKSDKYAGGASIDVHWIDGPSVAMVDSIALTFKGAYFDGMTDYKGSTYAMVNGLQTRFGADFVHCHRSHSDAAVERAIAQLTRKWGTGAMSGVTVDDFRNGRLCHRYPDDINGFQDYTLQSLIHQAMYKHSFYLAPRKSATAGAVIYLGNDGYSEVGALQVAD